jgi:hypothetical protein
VTLVSKDGDALHAPIRVAICVPCQDLVHASWAFDLASMVGLTTYLRPDISLINLQVKGTLLPDQRNSLVKRALNSGATHLLWLDADMRFPKDALLRLLAHDRPIVGTNYTTRRFPHIPTAEIAGEGLVYIVPGSEGLLEVSRIGFGCVLMQAEVFAKLPQPWFTLAWAPKIEEHTGEDIYFCRKAREHGYQVEIDLKLSRQIGHLGELNYTAEAADEMRAVAEDMGKKAKEVGRGAILEQG